MKTLGSMSGDDILEELKSPEGRHMAIAKYVEKQLDLCLLHHHPYEPWMLKAMDILDEIYPSSEDEREIFSVPSFMQGF